MSLSLSRGPSFRLRLTVVAGMTLLCSLASAQTVVSLQNATATYSQASYPISKTIDGVTNDNSGWAVGEIYNTTHTAAFETVADLGFGGGTLLSFTLTQAATNLNGLLLGRFRISITTDDRSTFADGLSSNGNVTANWVVLTLTSLSSAGGSTLTTQMDGSVLASGTPPNTDIYTFSAVTGATGITGIRLEAMPDATLPAGGPGRYANGNFVLSEFAVTATAIPEPATAAALIGVFSLVLALAHRRKISKLAA